MDASIGSMINIASFIYSIYIPFANYKDSPIYVNILINQYQRRQLKCIFLDCYLYKVEQVDNMIEDNRSDVFSGSIQDQYTGIKLQNEFTNARM